MAPAPLPAHLSRRSLLVAAASGVALAACGTGSDGDASDGATTAPGTSTPAATTGTSVDSAQARALEAAGLGDAAVGLAPQLTWPELIVAPDQYVQFVVADPADADGGLLTDPVQVWLVDEDANVAAGPLTSTWYPDDRIPTGGLHSVVVTAPGPGVLDVVVATADGATAGTAAIQAMTAADSLAPGPGEVIPPSETPTTDDPQDLAELCTREPDCSLHDVTLAQALDTGPVVLCIATPKFCATAICGPVLDDVIAVADEGAFPEVSFVHVEPYTDAGETVTQLVTDLALPSEPWTFVLQPDGTVVHRFPGPVVPEILTDILGGLPAA